MQHREAKVFFEFDNKHGEFCPSAKGVDVRQAQIMVAKWLYRDCVPMLTEMLGHEIEHCRLFRQAMPERNSRPCRVMQFWSWGGWWLGFLTALLGRQGIWACTAAVEETVHRHLDDQLHFLAHRHQELYELIASIREEELGHLHHAEERLNARRFNPSLLRGPIAMVTDIIF